MMRVEAQLRHEVKACATSTISYTDLQLVGVSHFQITCYITLTTSINHIVILFLFFLTRMVNGAYIR
jgi:hypothetical protein